MMMSSTRSDIAYLMMSTSNRYFAAVDTTCSLVPESGVAVQLDTCKDSAKYTVSGRVDIRIPCTTLVVSTPLVSLTLSVPCIDSWLVHHLYVVADDFIGCVSNLRCDTQTF